MITPDYCATMARYNAWQNRQLKTALAGLDEGELTRDRGAFFGSILGTLNHLLWGDQLWMSRFDGLAAPQGGIPESPALMESRAEWEIARFRTDGAILFWAEKLDAVDLAGRLSWFSGALNREVTKPLATCVAHMFNHQTHHRGQVHAMLTSLGAPAPVSDLPFMPEDGPVL